MMKSKDLKNVTAHEARKTALLVAAVSLLAAAFFWYRGRSTAMVAAVSISVTLAVIGVFIPDLAKLFHRGWMRFAFALGYVNSRILLTVIYVVFFIPYGILSRLFGRDPLDLRSEERESYWHRRPVTRQTKEGFERLF
jgi:hypothetical protein